MFSSPPHNSGTPQKGSRSQISESTGPDYPRRYLGTAPSCPQNYPHKVHYLRRLVCRSKEGHGRKNNCFLMYLRIVQTMPSISIETPSHPNELRSSRLLTGSSDRPPLLNWNRTLAHEHILTRLIIVPDLEPLGRSSHEISDTRIYRKIPATPRIASGAEYLQYHPYLLY